MAETETRVIHKCRGKAVYLVSLLVLIVAGICWYRSGSPRVTFDLGGVVHSVAFSPDGKCLATGSHDDRGNGIITLWDVSTYRLIARWVAHNDFITSLVFDVDGRTLISEAVVRGDGQPPSEMKAWDLSTFKELELRHKQVKPSVDFGITSPTGKVVVKNGGRGVLVLIDAGTREELFRLPADPYQLNCAAFSPDGTVLATGGGDNRGGGPSPFPGTNGDLRRWEVSTGRLLAKYNRHWWGPIMDVAFSPDGKIVATASLDGTVKLWDVPKP